MNYIGIAKYLVLALLLMGVVYVVHGEESYVTVNESPEINGVIYWQPLNYVPYVEQGQTVYVNDTVDISGTVPPYPYLAYWDGYDMYDYNATYIIDLPIRKSGYYKFYIDPAIFGTRTGNWYKWDGKFESQGNNLAFVVSPAYFDNSTLRFPNGTIVNLSMGRVGLYNISVTPYKPPVPIKHISDFLIARGDPFNLTVTEPTNLWLFGRSDQLLDHSSINKTVNISDQLLSHFEPGNYKLMTQTIRNGSSSFTVRYNNETNALEWFDPSQFTVHKENLDGLSPQVVQEKFNRIIPNAYDDFKTFDFVLQDPSLEITSIEEKENPNMTIRMSGAMDYNTNISFVRVLGYTNVAPASVLRFVLDEKQQTPRTIKSHTTTVTAEGTYGGDMRWFQVNMPVDKYGLAAGEHTITGYTNSSSGTTVTFWVYDAPEGTYLQKKTVRYVGGYEFVPTPTPIVETVTVIQTIPVIQTVTVEVTPEPEVVKEQQGSAIVDILIMTVAAVLSCVIIGLAIRYLVDVMKRAKVE